MNKEKFQKMIKWSALIALPLLCISFFTQKVYAEGTTDLGTEDTGEDGYRPYTERNKAKTFGQERLSHMQVYLKQGETVYFGTSVSKGTLYNETTASGYLFTNAEMNTNFSTEELKYLNSADVWVYQGTADELKSGSLPYENGSRNNNVFLIDIDANATNTTPGFIYNGAQEKGGVDLDGTGTGYKVTSVNTLTPVGSVAKSAKTNANTFTAPKDGIYSVVFFSKSLTAENPTMMKLSDTTTPFEKTQKGSTIASWDISVYNNGTKQSGRVFTKTLFLNMGGNALVNKVSVGSLYSKIYAVTNDGYQYKVDFNGMDPYGFVFFANNRGLLNTENNTSSSLYHGVRSRNNLLSDLSQHYLATNITPYDQSTDQTYNMFYETPSQEALNALKISSPSTSGGIHNFAFKGTGYNGTDTNTGYVGKGGSFSFDADTDLTATSYEIDLDFSSIHGGTVVLSNALKSGTNTISWDGKDANGNVVPAGTYQTLNATIKLKGGEVHFPLLDVEQNLNGVKITRLNGAGTDSEKATVYFNNSSANAGDSASPWTIQNNWEVGSQTDASVSGVDTSSTGAMAFTNVNTDGSAKGMRLLGDGDQSALDLWAYYNTNASLGTWSFSLKDTSFTVTKEWDNTAGKPAAGNPKNVTMLLRESSDGGTTYTKALKDASGALLTNPVTYDSTTPSYTWNHLDPSKMYQVTETTVTGYTPTYGTVNTTTGTDGTHYAETVTNRYKTTTLELKKIWNMNGTNVVEPDSVTFSVYTAVNKGGQHIGDYELDATKNWQYQVPSLDPTLTYYVYETAYKPHGAAASIPLDDTFNKAFVIRGDGKVNGNGDDGFTKTITNSYNNGNYMSVEVFKLWVDGKDESRPTSILVTLKKNGEIVKTDRVVSKTR